MRGTVNWLVGLSVSLVVGGAAALQVAATTAPVDPVLKIGIVQRFGATPQSDQLAIAATGGSQLVLAFAGANGQPQTQRLSQVSFDIHQKRLATPQEQHRLILSNHRSFESAETNARQWEALGVKTVVVQPDEWQVWADPEQYGPNEALQILLYARDRDWTSVRSTSQLLPAQPLPQWQVGDREYTSQRVEIRSSTGTPISVNGIPYAGTLTLQPNALSSYTLVNDVPLETYLRGVVPHEIVPQAAPPEAVKAQAILARTYALRNRHRFAPDRYELCADTQCQVYQGLKDTLPLTDQAIADTQGEVLTADNQLADAVYSSTTGGVTAAFEDVWDGEPRSYLKPVPDSLLLRTQIGKLDLSQESDLRQFLALRTGFNEAGLSSYFRWDLDQSLAKLTANLRENQKYLGIPLPPYKQIAGLEVLERSPSGRVLKLRVDLQQADGSITSVTLQKDAILLGLRATYSLLFTIDPIVENGQLTGYTFTGGGLGHGVGMSQYGSYHLASEGYSAKDIIEFYYPGAEISALTPELARMSEPTANSMANSRSERHKAIAQSLNRPDRSAVLGRSDRH
jgi:SpoIID/LytB domain protein